MALVGAANPLVGNLQKTYSQPRNPLTRPMNANSPMMTKPSGIIPPKGIKGQSAKLKSLYKTKLR